MEKSYSASYAAAGVDITAGYRAVELMKKHVARTRNAGCLDDVGGFGGCFGLPVAGMEEPVLVSGTDGCGTKVKLAILMDKHDRRHLLFVGLQPQIYPLGDLGLCKLIKIHGEALFCHFGGQLFTGIGFFAHVEYKRALAVLGFQPFQHPLCLVFLVL